MGSMDTMRAAVLTSHGGPESLELKDVELPIPGAGEVLVKVNTAALNNTDIWTREGAYGLPGDPDAKAGWRGPLSFPLIQGGDIAGEIVKVGGDISPERVGQRVFIDPAIYQDETPTAPPVGLLGSEADGGFAEYVISRADQAHDVSDSPLSEEQLSALPVSYGTAMGMLERAGVSEDETIVVTGASGGVGLALVQLAAARGAKVIAVTSGAKADEVLAAGAEHTVDRRAGDLAEQIIRYSGRKLDAVADIAGGPMVAQILPLVRDDGRWVIAGAVAGQVIEFDLRRLYLHNISLIGSSMHTREHFDTLIEAARSGAVAPVIAKRFPLEQLAEAQEFFSRGEYVGKVVVSVGATQLAT